MTSLETILTGLEENYLTIRLIKAGQYVLNLSDHQLVIIQVVLTSRQTAITRNNLMNTIQNNIHSSFDPPITSWTGNGCSIWLIDHLKSASYFIEHKPSVARNITPSYSCTTLKYSTFEA